MALWRRGGAADRGASGILSEALVFFPACHSARSAARTPRSCGGLGCQDKQFCDRLMVEKVTACVALLDPAPEDYEDAARDVLHYIIRHNIPTDTPPEQITAALLHD